MLIIGCDYHPGFQQIALVDTDRGELSERRLLHREKRSSLSQAAGARAEGACRDGALSLRKATGQLRRAGSDGRVQRRSSPAGPHQQARQRSAGGSGAGHGAESTGVAQQVLSPGHAAWTEDCESSDGAETGGAPVLDVAPSICPCSVLNCNRASIDPSDLCLVATQAGRSLFRRIRLLPILCTDQFFFGLRIQS